MSKYILLVTVIFLSGCASMAGVAVQTQKIGGEPFNQKIVHSISIGEVLYSEYKYRVSPGAKITSVKSRTIMGGYVMPHLPLSLTIMANDEKAYCGRTYLKQPLASLKDIYVCFFDMNEDNKFDDFMWGGQRNSSNDKIPYVKVEQVVTGEDGFKREIIFQGRTKDTLKFKYREFKNDFARPAFSQELEYLLAADGTTSGSFKGVKIEVVSVNGNYIKYRVTGHIDEPVMSPFH